MTFVVFVFLFNFEKNVVLLAEKVRNITTAVCMIEITFSLLQFEKQKHNINKFWVIKMLLLLFFFCLIWTILSLLLYTSKPSVSRIVPRFLHQ